MNKIAAVADTRFKTNHIYWYVAHYTISMQQQDFLSKQVSSKLPRELQHNERSFFLKGINNQNLWNFELGSQESINFPICIL